MIRRVHELRPVIQADTERSRAFREVINRYDAAYSMRLYVHETLFRETVYTQGTDAQREHWVPLIDSFDVIGCFAMTELGHRSVALRGVCYTS